MKQDRFNKNMNESVFPFAGGQSDQILTGGFFILMGVIFLMGALGITILGRSAWFLAALLPLYWILVVTWRCFREDGRVSRRVLAVLIWGLLPLAFIAAAFLGWNVGAIWPLGIIAMGLGMLLIGSGK